MCCCVSASDYDGKERIKQSKYQDYKLPGRHTFLEIMLKKCCLGRQLIMFCYRATQHSNRSHSKLLS